MSMKQGLNWNHRWLDLLGHLEFWKLVWNCQRIGPVIGGQWLSARILTYFLRFFFTFFLIILKNFWNYFNQKVCRANPRCLHFAIRSVFLQKNNGIDDPHLLWLGWLPFGYHLTTILISLIFITVIYTFLVTLTLTQNERSGSKSLIVFEVMFSKQCQFKPSEIEIIWDESFPAQKFPEQFKNVKLTCLIASYFYILKVNIFTYKISLEKLLK